MKSTFIMLASVLMLCVYTIHAQFSVSYRAGTMDTRSQFVGGTEMRALANHKGMLFGGVETWMDDTTGTGDPFIGAQIVRLDSREGQWVLDKHFDTFFPQLKGRERKRNEGITALESVVFKTDKNGKALAVPDTVLIAAARDFTGVLSVYTRNDASTLWTETQIGSVPVDTTGSTDNDGTIRSFILYRDKITGIDRVFAGSLPNGIISGVYDASLPGKIQWNTTPELTGFVGRPMAFAVCNGDLFCAIAPNVWRRTDGPVPAWNSVYSYPFIVTPGGSSGLRGLTTVNNPIGAGQSLIAALEGQTSKIFRITPTGSLPYTAVTEYDVDTAMTAAFGYPGNYYVVANSEMTWLTEPATGDSVLTITIQHHPANIRDDAFYVTRKQKGGSIVYSLKKIDNTVFAPLTILNSTRAIVPSPFARDTDAVFIGGYDADNNVSHNTAYVLRATKAAFFTPVGSTPADPGLKHRVIIPSLTDGKIEDTFGYHQTYVNTAVAPLHKLFLFLPGSNSTPFAYDEIQKLAANLGYHSLGISYSNATISPMCSGSSDSLCFDKVRNEVIDGVDLTPLVSVNIANSITNRILKALQYLDTAYPAEQWGQFYNGSSIAWSKMAVAGHSQGGGHAALIAKQHVVDRAALFAAPKDYFTAPLRKAAPWESLPTLTPTNKYYAFVHQSDNQGCTAVQQLEIFSHLGIDAFAPQPTFFETNGGDYNGSHIILSSLPGLTGSSAHNIVVVDVAAATVNKVPFFTPVWKYMLTAVDAGTTGINPIGINDYLTFAIDQNYPNPFNPSTTIRYTVPTGGFVDVKIFDIQGRLVRSLCTAIQEAGTHSLLWDSRNSDGGIAASGTYLCRVQFNGSALVQKLVLIK